MEHGQSDEEACTTVQGRLEAPAWRGDAHPFRGRAEPPASTGSSRAAFGRANYSRDARVLPRVPGLLELE